MSSCVLAPGLRGWLAAARARRSPVASHMFSSFLLCFFYLDTMACRADMALFGQLDVDLLVHRNLSICSLDVQVRDLSVLTAAISSASLMLCGG